MKRLFFLIFFSISIIGLWAQNFSIPAGAVLLESTEFKTNGVPYIIERRYKLSSGEILYAYYDVDGSNSVTIQRMEQVPILALGKEINITGMPGYREFNFGDDRRQLVQFMKIMTLGEKNYRGGVKTPSLSDFIFNINPPFKSEFKLLLDLLDDTWVLEHNYYTTYDGKLLMTNTTALLRVRTYNE